MIISSIYCFAPLRYSNLAAPVRFVVVNGLERHVQYVYDAFQKSIKMQAILLKEATDIDMRLVMSNITT